MFEVNQRVICVDDSGWEPYRKRFQYPTPGQTYTVRELVTAPDGSLAIRLIEIANREAPNFTLNIFAEPFFRASRFRPLTERKHSTEAGVELLRKIARDVPVRERV